MIASSRRIASATLCLPLPPTSTSSKLSEKMARTRVCLRASTGYFFYFSIVRLLRGVFCFVHITHRSRDALHDPSQHDNFCPPKTHPLPPRNLELIVHHGNTPAIFGPVLFFLSEITQELWVQPLISPYAQVWTGIRRTQWLQPAKSTLNSASPRHRWIRNPVLQTQETSQQRRYQSGPDTLEPASRATGIG